MLVRRHSILWAPLLAALGWVAFPSDGRVQDASVPATSSRVAQFGGVWHLATPRAEAVRIVDAAAEETASRLSFLVRRLAHGRLVQGTPVVREIELRFEPGGRLMTRLRGGDQHTTRIGHSERRRSGNGDAVTLTQRFRPSGQLEQVFEAAQGTRWYVWTPRPDGRMRIEVTTGSPRLPQAMRFSLDYQRP